MTLRPRQPRQTTQAGDETASGDRGGFSATRTADAVLVPSVRFELTLHGF